MKTTRLLIERMYFLAEKVAVVGAILYLVGAVAPLLRDPEHTIINLHASDSTNLLLQAVVYMAVMPFVILNGARILKAIASNPVLCSIVLLVLFSILWSAEASLSRNRAITTAMSAVFGCYFGTRFKFGEQIRLVACALAACIALSVVLIVVFPGYGTDVAYSGAWRGVFGGKNALGCYMVVAAITFLCFRAQNVFELCTKYICLLLSVCLLIGSKSAGSYVVMIVASFLVIFFKLLHLHSKRLLPALIIVSGILAAAVVFVVSNADTFLKLLGRNASLTGRIPLWVTLLSISSGHRWLGYGAGAFWGTNSHRVWQISQWKPAHAHNGYIEIVLDIGLVGLSLFLLNAGIAFWRCGKLVARERTLESKWPLLILSICLLSGTFEMNLTAGNTFFWVAYVAITVSSGRYLLAERNAAQTARTPTDLSAREALPCPQS